jgi:hypothetical protein
MICIGTDGDIIPNYDCKIGSRTANMTTVVMRACSQVLDCVTLYAVEESSTLGLEHTQKVLVEATVSVHDLFKLKQNILGVSDSEFRCFKSLKDHFNSCHFCIQCKTLGTAKYTDCMAFEHKHLLSGVFVFNRTSKKKSTRDKEMLTQSMKLQRAEVLKVSVQNADRYEGIGDCHDDVNLYPEQLEGKPSSMKAATSYRGVQIVWNTVTAEFQKLNRGDKPLPLHPFFNLKSLSSLLNDYFFDVPSWNETRGRSKIVLEHGMTYQPESDTGLDVFTVFSTATYLPSKRKYRN